MLTAMETPLKNFEVVDEKHQYLHGNKKQYKHIMEGILDSKGLNNSTDTETRALSRFPSPPESPEPKTDLCFLSPC